MTVYIAVVHMVVASGIFRVVSLDWKSSEGLCSRCTPVCAQINVLPYFAEWAHLYLTGCEKARIFNMHWSSPDTLPKAGNQDWGKPSEMNDQ